MPGFVKGSWKTISLQLAEENTNCSEKLFKLVLHAVADYKYRLGLVYPILQVYMRFFLV